MKNGEITGFISKELNQYKESGINLEYTVMLLQLTDVQNTNSSILVFAWIRVIFNFTHSTITVFFSLLLSSALKV